MMTIKNGKAIDMMSLTRRYQAKTDGRDSGIIIR